MVRRALVMLVGLLLMVGLVPAAAAADPPRPITVPGGLPAGERLATVDTHSGTPDAAASNNCSATDVHCKPDVAGSCTGNVDQNTPPSTIRVLTGTTADSIVTVDFRSYVEDSLYNEWVPSWNGDAVKAGAVAVKSFAWYWATHYGGYVGSAPSASTCFDISPDTNFFQAWVPGTGSKDAKTVARVAATWPVAVRSSGDVVETHYQKSLSKPSEPCGYLAGGTIDSYMSQYGSQACSTSNNSNNGYRYNVILQLYYGKDIELATPAQRRAQHDFTFTARSTPAALNAGNWTIADGYPTTFRLGSTGDVPIASTAGDGFATAGVYRPSTSTFFRADALHRLVSTQHFGTRGDVPVPAHYNGLDEPTQLAVFRPSNGTWYLATPSGTVAASVAFGRTGDIPVPGRWRSTSTDSQAVFRPATGTWYVRNSAAVAFGRAGDVPAPADYNGDGITEIAVYRPANSTFYVQGRGAVPFGRPGDVPVTGDFTGDGPADFAVYRPSTRTVYVRGGAASVVGAGVPVGAAPFRG